MKKALFVIDMQRIFVGKDHAKLFDYDKNLIDNVNGIIEENRNNIVVYFTHFMKRNFVNKFAPYHVYEKTPESELAEELNIVSENKFFKYKGDAFSNPELDKFLKQNNVDTVEVIGVDGAACVPMTAIGALKNGYKVVVNEKGIGTFKLYTKRKERYDKKLKQLGAQYK